MAIKLEAVLFDLDGVLVDACEWHYHALNFALVDFGYDPIDENSHAKTYNGLPTKVKLGMLGIPQDFIGKIDQRKQKYTLDIIRNTAKIMPEKLELHEYLHSKGIKIACVTNSIHETALHMLAKTGQLPYIDLLISNEMVKRNKPHPDCYNLAIDTLQVDGNKCLCVEDSEKGAAAAKESDAKFLWKVKTAKDVTLDNFISFFRN